MITAPSQERSNQHPKRIRLSANGRYAFKVKSSDLLYALMSIIIYIISVRISRILTNPLPHTIIKYGISKGIQTPNSKPNSLIPPFSSINMTILQNTPLPQPEPQSSPIHHRFHTNNNPTATPTPSAIAPSIFRRPAPAISSPPGSTGSCHPQCVYVPKVLQLQNVVTCHFCCRPKSKSSALGGSVICGFGIVVICEAG